MPPLRELVARSSTSYAPLRRRHDVRRVYRSKDVLARGDRDSVSDEKFHRGGFRCGGTHDLCDKLGREIEYKHASLSPGRFNC